MTFQGACMIIAGLAYCGAAAGYAADGQYALGLCMLLYAASIGCLMYVGSH